MQVQSNLALRTFSVSANLALKVKNVLILTVIYYINHQLAIDGLVPLKVKHVLILTTFLKPGSTLLDRLQDWP